MLTYDFHDQGTDSLYTYLYRRIREDILEGRLAGGEKLPSKRALAAQLGISVITVENAYAQLTAEGYLRAKARSGYYVEEIGDILLRPENVRAEAVHGYHGERSGEAEPREAAFGETAACESTAGGISAGNRASGEPSTQIDLVDSHADPSLFPFPLWSRLLHEILRTKQEDLLRRPPGTGVLELREAIAQYLLQYQSLSVSPEQIVIGAGTEYLYGLLIRLLGPEKIYAVETPGYQKTARIYASNRVEVKSIPMDENGIDVALLDRSGADIVHISPSHQFPTGITMPVSRRSALISWCRKAEGRYVIEDDYDSEFRLSGRPVPSLMSMDRSGRVIYLNTFTKSVASTIRISYMVLPDLLMARYREQLGFYSCTVPTFEQYVLAAFIRRGHFEKHINRLRTSYRKKRDHLLTALRASALAGRIEILGADTGLHFLVRVHVPLSERELTEHAAKAGVRIHGLSHYETPGAQAHPAVSEKAVPCMVISCQGLSEEQIDRLPGLLAGAWL